MGLAKVGSSITACQASRESCLVTRVEPVPRRATWPTYASPVLTRPDGHVPRWPLNRNRVPHDPGAVHSDIGDLVLVVGYWSGLLVSRRDVPMAGSSLAQQTPGGAGTDHSPRPFSLGERGPVSTD